MEQNYSKHYSEGDFWKTVRNQGAKIPFLRDILAMYHCFQDDTTPLYVKSLIIAALGYFVFPFDAVPDTIPVVGWFDDAGVIAATLAIVKMHVRPEHWAKADEIF